MTQKDDSYLPIRAYGKSELAMLYFPTANSAHTAENHLVSWMNRCTELMQALEEIRYIKTRKFFTSREVSLIVDYLGYP